MKRAISGGRLAKILAVAASLLSAVASAQSPMFSVQVLEDLPGSTESFVFGINNAGDAVGYTDGSAAVIWRDLMPTLLGQLADGSFAYSVNNSGQAVGYGYVSAVDPTQALVWNNGLPSVLPTPGPPYTNTQASFINDSGQAVGRAYEGDTLIASVAMVWNGTTPTALGTLSGYAEGGALGINNSGLIVGYLCCGSGMQSEAVVWHGTTPTLLPKLTPGQKTAGRAMAVNDSGLVVGQAYNATAQAGHAVAWAKGVVTDLGTLSGMTTSYATALNNLGVIVGGSDALGPEERAVIWSRVGATIQDLNTLISADSAAKIFLTQAEGINDSCSIVANGAVKGTGTRKAFVLTLTDPALCVNGGI